MTVSEMVTEGMMKIGIGSFFHLVWWLMFLFVLLVGVRILNGIGGGVLKPSADWVRDTISMFWSKSSAVPSDLENRVAAIELKLGMVPPKPLTPEEEIALLKKQLEEAKNGRAS